jgi:hypothetical protein
MCGTEKSAARRVELGPVAMTTKLVHSTLGGASHRLEKPARLTTREPAKGRLEAEASSDELKLVVNSCCPLK